MTATTKTCVRVVIEKHSDPAKDLEVAGDSRHDLWAKSAVEIDPDDLELATRRNAVGEAFFEFETEFFDDVKRVKRESPHATNIKLFGGMSWENLHPVVAD